MAQVTTTFTYTGGTQTYAVPRGCYVVAVAATGGSGVDGVFAGAAVSAYAGTSQATVLVTPGETLAVAVGAAGGTTVGGFTPNGSTLGRGAPGAGASSHVARGATRLLVAAGAGAGTADAAGGNGAGTIGGHGRGYGLEGAGGGADPTYSSSDGEAAPAAGCGGGGGGFVGGRAGTPGVLEASPAGGAGSGKVPAGGTMATATATGTGLVTITYGMAPYAPTLASPAAGAAFDRASDLSVLLAFTGACAQDTQSACQVVTDAGQTFPGGSGSQVTIPGGSIPLGDVSLRARVANQFGTWSDWGPWVALHASSAPPAPVFTSPADGSTVGTSSLLVAWTSVGQVAYDLQRCSDAAGAVGSTVYADSGTVAGSSTSAVVDLPVNGQWEHVVLRVQDANGVWSPPAQRRYLARRSVPAQPTATATAVASLIGVGGQTDAIDVAIVNPAVAGTPAAASNNVYAGPAGGPLDQVNPVPVPVNSTWRWELPASSVDYLVVVEAVTADGGATASIASGSPHVGYGAGPYGSSPYGR